MDKLCRIKDYFSGRSVLLTGGTGFIGMALIEGLLSASPDLGCVFVLVREKRGMSPEERVARLLSSEIFAHLSAEALAKVVPVVGELTAENLGLSAAVLAQIRDSVSVVIHNAGLIKFNRTLAEAVQMNVLSTLRCIDLAKSLRHLSAFIYSSTALSNSNIAGRVRELVYKTKRSPREMIKLSLETPSRLNKVFEIGDNMMEGHQNSYTYSKQLAENLILEEMAGLPAGIVRPSLVYGFYDHPIRGWLGNSKSSHCGFIKGYMKGALRSWFGDAKLINWCVPCDYVVKGTLALAVSLGTKPEPERRLQIIHTSNNKSINPLTMQDFCNVMNEESWKNPCDSYLFLPRCKPRVGWRADLYLILNYLFALMFYIPDHLFNFSPGWITGPNMIVLQHKASKYFAGLSTCLDDLEITNCQALSESLHSDDQKAYSFDMAKVNWNRMFGSCISWTRKYYYKDSCSVTWMHRIVQVACLTVEAMWYFSIFFGTTLAILILGFLLEYTFLYVLLVGLTLGLGFSGFVLWL
ncbi:putative fatty acyl-CoA reductase CG8303 [Phlebotomus argentipes]|uniref:putative fatty acyl-CoA reductase CG8303 n=1 Tax=Phlebotomus argentipes TaxID=94469 RepID=UPI0028929C3E|nr:putative fatty acyl-CoA reductase CG8303 [Phlebotomus argentipes]